MPTKRQRLVERAAATTRRPRPARLLDEGQQKKGYRVVAVSLYVPEAEWIDHTSRTLQRAGNAKANRSLVVREAILRLQEELKDKSPEEVMRYFLEHQAKRVAA
jgi:hypothetical protein